MKNKRILIIEKYKRNIADILDSLVNLDIFKAKRFLLAIPRRSG